MTDADFHSITRNGRLCDGEGALGQREFELVMREQVRRRSADSGAASQQCCWLFAEQAETVPQGPDDIMGFSRLPNPL